MKLKKTKVGIIGGTGQMGQFFRKVFEQNDCEVLVSSRNTKLKLIDCVKKSDVIVISVPISATIETIRNLAPYAKKDALLCDLTSIKKEPCSAMLRHSKCEVIGMHPVFGPGVNSLKNQTIVICPLRGEKWLKWLLKIFEREKAKIKITSPKKHDKMMAIIQGLNHFSTLGVAHAMKSLGIELKETLEFTSPIYKLRIAMVGRILNQDPSLYASLEIDNSKNNEVLKAYMESSKKLFEIINSKNRKEFLEYFSECAGFFGDFRKESEKISNHLLNEIVKIEK